MAGARIAISGASRGIGAAAARLAGAAGCAVALNARSEEPLAALAAELRAGGTEVVTVAGDIAAPGVAAGLVAAACETFGGLDAVISNAGVLEPIGPLAECDPEALERALATNVIGGALLVRAALAPLRAAGGRLVAVSSGAAIKVVRGWAAYCAAKAAIDHLVRVVAAEEPEVTALSCSPGMTATGMQALIRERGAGRMPAEEHRRFLTAHREGRLRSPEDAARALVALALAAPREWSGELLVAGEERLEALIGELGL